MAHAFNYGTLSAEAGGSLCWRPRKTLYCDRPPPKPPQIQQLQSTFPLCRVCATVVNKIISGTLFLFSFLETEAHIAQNIPGLELKLGPWPCATTSNSNFSPYSPFPRVSCQGTDWRGWSVGESPFPLPGCCGFQSTLRARWFVDLSL